VGVRSIIVHRTWTLEPDKLPDAAPNTFAMECDVCGEKSVDFDEPALGYSLPRMRRP
jgi:hypothetical protein